MLTKRIVKQLKPFMYEQGYQLHNKNFYKIENHIAFCVTFENPGGFYALCFPMPLYLPDEFASYQYGMRLAASSSRELPYIDRTASDEEITAWCQTFSGYLEKNVFPYFQEVCDPIRMARFFQKKANQRKMLCPPLDVDRLLMFTAFFLKDKRTFDKAAVRYQKSLADCSYLMPDVVARLKKELEEACKLIESSEAKIDLYFASLAEETIKLL